MKKVVLTNVFLASLVLSPLCIAGPADYLYTPHIERGELELDVKYGVASSNVGAHPQAASIGLGYGVTEYWFTEGYLKQKHAASGDSTYLEWENRFLLVGGEGAPVDIGWVTELEAPLTSVAPWELRTGPLFQSTFGKLQLNGNVIFERAFGGADEDSVGQVTNMGYQWQVRYRAGGAFDLGAQGVGEMGKWDQWSKAADQNHRMGPALYGKLALGEGESIKYNAACLVGMTNAAPKATLRMQMEYEF
ncbi:MAG: hypothetical protein C0406_00450 [Sideroxydans sp.]|nr:hypothetical protein [Sideroxydans sp.]